MSTVLLVDDEKGYRNYVKRGLERAGNDVRLATTAHEAIAILRDSAIDILIVDIRLSDGDNGLDLAERIKKENADIALVVITGFSSPECEERSRRLGAIEYLEKPFDLRSLEACVHRFRDHCELLRQIRCLQQELASAQIAATAAGALAAWPIACFSLGGELLYATAHASVVLEMGADPALPRPIERLDEFLLERLRSALPPAGGVGRTTLFRRDGVASHFTAFVRRVDWQERAAMMVFFLDADHEPPCAVALDDAWVEVFRNAVCSSDVPVAGS